MKSMPRESEGKTVARGFGHMHFVGVCGVGMAGLAALLARMGCRVSGCDKQLNRQAEWLRENGVEVVAGHDAGHIGAGVDCVVRTSAVSEDAPEIQRAMVRGIPVFLRGEILARVLRLHRSVAVSGTHGKTTTSTFVTQLLRAAGLDPSWCIGGECRPGEGTGGSGFGVLGVSGSGKGEWIVVEADESDGTLAGYRPDIAVVTNIERDHMEHFGNIRRLERCFGEMISGTRGRVVYCADDPRANRLCRARADAVGYGFGDRAMLRAVSPRPEGLGQSFEVRWLGRRLGRLQLPMAGRHNALNALAATAVGLEAGLAFAAIRNALQAVQLPLRRFEKVVNRPDLLVISDYGHHPSEIASVVGMLPSGRRTLAVFQPHRYTRTKALGPEFPVAFRGIDELVLTPVYAASEAPLSGGTVWDLYAHFRKAGARGAGWPSVAVAGSLERAWAHLGRRLRRRDTLLVLGAGDVERIAGWARDRFGVRRVVERSGCGGWARLPAAIARIVRRDEPLDGRTTLRVGGSAEFWAEPESVGELARLLKWCKWQGLPWRALGAGSNVLAGDLGVPGLTVRLGGAGFREIRREVSLDDGTLIVAGAGVPLARLLDRVEAWGLAGLEFLHGIPGTVGGALCMNAGAWGFEIGRRVEWVRAMAPDGSIHSLNADRIGFAYRQAGGLAGLMVLEAGLRAEPGDAGEIRTRRSEFGGRRKWMNGLRCAGSIFKNPPGDAAGRLIERAGLKGRSVGGARVSRRHGNVIVTRAGARASDVRALLELVRAGVRNRFGIWLETEVAIWE